MGEIHGGYWVPMASEPADVPKAFKDFVKSPKLAEFNAHQRAADPHTNYLNVARADARYLRFISGKVASAVTFSTNVHFDGPVAFKNTVSMRSLLSADGGVNAAVYKIRGRDVVTISGDYTRLMHIGKLVVTGSGIDHLYLGGVPHKNGAFDLQCDESGANRRVFYAGSSKRYKKDIETSEMTGGECLKWKPKKFRFKSEDNSARPKHWFIAEDIFEDSGEDFVKRTEGDEIANTNRDAMLVDLVLTVQDMAKRMQDTMKRLDALEA